MRKILHILKGWGKAKKILKTSDNEKHLSAIRMKICGKCVHASPSSFLRLVNDKAIQENGLKCMKCKCPCLEKSLVIEEKCPIGKW